MYCAAYQFRPGNASAQEGNYPPACTELHFVEVIGLWLHGAGVDCRALNLRKISTRIQRVTMFNSRRDRLELSSSPNQCDAASYRSPRSRTDSGDRSFSPVRMRTRSPSSRTDSGDRSFSPVRMRTRSPSSRTDSGDRSFSPVRMRTRSPSSRTDSGDRSFSPVRMRTRCPSSRTDSGDRSFSPVRMRTRSPSSRTDSGDRSFSPVRMRARCPSSRTDSGDRSFSPVRMRTRSPSSRTDSGDRSFSPVRMRARCPTASRSRPDPNRRHAGILHQDDNIHPCRENQLDMDLEEVSLRRNRNHKRPRPRRYLENIDIDEHLDLDDIEPDICRDIEICMNDIRTEIDMATNLMQISFQHHFDMEISRPKICKRKMYLENREERRFKDECNIGLIQATERNDLGSVTTFVDRGAGLLYTNADGWTALHIAASKGFSKIADFLISRGLYIDCTTPERKTPLMLAARSNESATVNCLLQKEASLRHTDKEGRTPLMHAAEAAGRDILKMMTDRGADVNLTDNDGKTALIVAAMHKNDAAVNFFVTQNEVDLEKKSKENNWTALHWAVATESEGNIRTLVKAGAALNACSFNKGETPIKLASRLGNRTILRLMHSLEAMSHRRIVYCSDGTEMKCYLFIIGPPLQGEPEEQLPTLSPETQNLFQAMQEELRRQEPALQEERRTRQGELSQALPDTQTHSKKPHTETALSQAMTKQEPSQEAEFDEKAKQLERRKEIQSRRRLIKRKLDPILAGTADDLRNSADSSCVLDQIYPPPLEVKIQVFTLLFLCLETESVRVQNVSCVSVVGINQNPITKKPNRRG
ncbi:hypothetical protein RRG08_025730 [Elysia crispata]|uniref:Uncharacterized protein n=1 Tax=Elysia crispata TaxID=231223 RepID=A0AAE1AGM6_9GAST|nr:hypothetical protein RRG08_025730 [Elysia crispata]